MIGSSQVSLVQQSLVTRTGQRIGVDMGHGKGERLYVLPGGQRFELSQNPRSVAGPLQAAKI
jgi:hypothetical protein